MNFHPGVQCSPGFNLITILFWLTEPSGAKTELLTSLTQGRAGYSYNTAGVFQGEEPSPVCLGFWQCNLREKMPKGMIESFLASLHVPDSRKKKKGFIPFKNIWKKISTHLHQPLIQSPQWRRNNLGKFRRGLLWICNLRPPCLLGSLSQQGIGKTTVLHYMAR